MNLTRNEFLKVYESGKNFFFYETIPSDLSTPVSALIKVSGISPYHLLFESVTGGEKKGRYSIIALDPDLIWKVEKKTASISYDLKNYEKIAEGRKIFDSLRYIANNSKIEPDNSLPPMAAGLFGFMGYDMVKLMENIPDNNPAHIDIPDGLYFRPKNIIVFDNIKDKVYVICPVYIDDRISSEKAYSGASGRVGNIIEKLRGNISDSKADTSSEKPEFRSHVSQSEYYNMVETSKEYIRAGDIFQIVPSRRFSADFKLSPISFYRSLRSLNPSPYLFYLNLNGFNLIGSSPEIMVKLKDNKVTVRPIAGTRKRGKNEAEDIALQKDLLDDQKEIAEHLMLLDLGRNDVGRVAKPGTVKVTDRMIIEKYSHVMHIVSNVEGTLAEGKDFMDVLIAGFPAGTVSGAPKIRAMEIIDELEPEKRQFYAGTVGYISNTGEIDTCIALRTALIKDGKIYIQAGGGVVYDSSPEGEYQESHNKALALMKAAEDAINYV